MTAIPLHWVSRCRQYRVHVSAECLRNMIRLATESLPQEIGTSLYGSYTADGFHAQVLGHGPVALDSRGSRFGFVRGIEGSRRFFVSLYRKTRGQKHYVGEWHSHPGGPPAPSGVDDINQTRIAQDARTNCPECIMLILAGIIPSAVSLGVYVYSRKHGRVDLTPEEDSDQG